MVYRISFFLTLLLRKNGIISESQTELYEYGFQITIANFLNFIIALFIGMVFHSVIEVALFYCVFVSLRFFCGGYHAESYGKCFLLFAITNILCLYGARILTGLGHVADISFFVSVLWLAWCIWTKAPLEHSNRPLSQGEKACFKKRAVQVFCFWTSIGIILWVSESRQLVANLISTFIAVSILMFKSKKEERKMEKKILELLAKVAGRAAKRADGRASEFGMHQPKKPENK